MLTYNTTKIITNLYMEGNCTAALQQEEFDQEIEYDEDGHPIAPPEKTKIDPLTPIDNNEMGYE
ncbi:ATP-dependent RNA helicase DDX42-like [Odontomachus brunneus]|uniref:ATP-dependent RNA helicase DDX42-like n=1 Tax=Odontomachus brunneus TaxID=486640 RepID=UPI0013F24658|nr:ATP-dependent RNA helicase DDX42-like [Odontomachus brunneus]